MLESLNTDRRILALAALLVIARSAVFVFYEGVHFDSDQAIMGIMAKHLSEASAFPVFCYGQKYLLAIDAWMAAPFFLIFGATTAALKLPLLIVNVLVAVLLVRGLVRDGLRPPLALLAVLPFVIPTVYLTKLYVAAHGGNIEPFLGVLLVWFLRDRPLLLGVTAAVFFVNRPFTAYGLVALIVIDLLRGDLFHRNTLRARGVAGAVFGVVVFAINMLARYGANYFGGTGPSLSLTKSPIEDGYLTVGTILPVVLNLASGPMPLAGIRAPVLFTWLRRIAPIVLAWVAFRVILRLWAGNVARDWRRFQFSIYLTITGTIAALAFVLLGGIPKDFFALRYTYLSILGLIGLYSLFFHVENNVLSRTVLISWLSVSALLLLLLHGRFAIDVIRHPPVLPERLIADRLVAGKIPVARAPYWTAYSASFLAKEAVVVTSSDLVRIQDYERQYAARIEEAVDLTRDRCPGREQVAGWYFCRAAPPR